MNEAELETEHTHNPIASSSSQRPPRPSALPARSSRHRPYKENMNNMKYRKRQSNQSLVPSFSYSRRQSSNRSLSSYSSDGSSSRGKIRPHARRTRLQLGFQSAPLIALRLDGGDAAATARHHRHRRSTTDRNPHVRSTCSRQRLAANFEHQAVSGRNEEWNDMLRMEDAGAKKNLFADLIQNSCAKVISPSSSPSPPPTATKRVNFSDKDELIEYEVSPQDVRNSWYAKNIPRTLENMDRISHHKGNKVSYPKSIHNGQECMIHIEPSSVINELLRITERHRGAVLKEQARQVGEGIADAEALGKIALETSERGVEIASSTWWLQRMNYRDSW